MNARRPRLRWRTGLLAAAAAAVAVVVFLWAFPGARVREVRAHVRGWQDFYAHSERFGMPTAKVPVRLYPVLLDEWFRPETPFERLGYFLQGRFRGALDGRVPEVTPAWLRRTACRLALARGGEDPYAALPLLAARWPSVPSEERWTAAHVMAALMTESDVDRLPLVLAWAEDPEPQVRAAAAEGLKTLEKASAEARRALAVLREDQVSLVRETARRER